LLEDPDTCPHEAAAGHEPSVITPVQIGAGTGTPLSLRLLDQFDHDAFGSTNEGKTQPGAARQRPDGNLGTSVAQFRHRGIRIIDG